MAEGYISKIECAGGCGVLLAQHLVDRGHKYLWGHKGGCPREGDPPRHRLPRGRRERKPKPGPTVVASYAMTLEMTREAYVELQSQREVLLAQSGRLLAAVEEIAERMRLLDAVRVALEALVEMHKGGSD